MGINHRTKNLGSKLKIGIGLNAGFTVLELVAGIFSGSLALISDAGHNLTDSPSLLIAFFAQKIAKKKQIQNILMDMDGQQYFLQ